MPYQSDGLRYAATNTKAGHRRNGPGTAMEDQLQCGTDLIAALTRALQTITQYVGVVEDMRDVRHHDAKAWPDVSDWLDVLAFEGKRERTRYNYERQLAPLLRDHPDLELGEFTHPILMRQLGKVPERSRYISRSIYKTFFDWADLDERIERNPMHRVPKLKAGPRRPTGIFTDTEIALLENLPLPDGALWTLLFGTGMRRGDAINLRRGHVDLDRLRVMIYDGKGGKDAIIPITPQTAAAVADFDLLEWVDPDDYLWYRHRYPVGDKRRRQHPIGSTTFERWYRDGINEAGVRYLKPHTTRHTYHWLLRQNGYDLEERQLLMRHESPNTTVRQYPAVDIEDVAQKLAQNGSHPDLAQPSHIDGFPGSLGVKHPMGRTAGKRPKHLDNA